MSVTIKSNNRWRNLLYGYELPAQWRKEFDWMEDEEYENALFVKVGVGEGRKKNNVWYYALNEFMRVPKIHSEDGPAFAKWDGYMNDTYFSGVLVKVSSDGEQYKIGTFYS